MINKLTSIKAGLALVMLGLIFGIGLGVTFGINEALFEAYVTRGIAAHPELHDANSPEKIWRYVQRAHFHATGIAAFSIGLLLLVSASSINQRFKTITAILIGLGGCYPLAWFTMFIVAPTIGTGAAHTHPVTELLTYIGVGGLLLGVAILFANLFFGLFSERNGSW